MSLSLHAPTSRGYITISAGCAIAGQGGASSPDALGEAAHAAMYRATNAGRNRIDLATTG